MSAVIRLTSDDMEIEVWTLGARLNGVWFQGIGSLVDGAASEDEARGAKKFNGAVVGPVANRIAGGAASIDGQTYEFERNENGITTLHSGASGVHALEWEVVEQTSNTLALQLKLEDGLGGFPGNRTLSVEYSVHGPAFEVAFQAGTDAPTWMNLALHPYWRLSKTGRDNMTIGVVADRYIPVDAEKIPTGIQADVTGTMFDLRETMAPDTEIDHNLCLRPVPPVQPQVWAEGDLGLRMEVKTTAPGVQIYAGKEIGIAIEPQHWPDAMHHAHFPSIELRPGDKYSQNSTYRFSRL